MEEEVYLPKLVYLYIRIGRKLQQNSIFKQFLASNFPNNTIATLFSVALEFFRAKNWESQNIFWKPSTKQDFFNKMVHVIRERCDL